MQAHRLCAVVVLHGVVDLDRLHYPLSRGLASPPHPLIPHLVRHQGCGSGG